MSSERNDRAMQNGKTTRRSASCCSTKLGMAYAKNNQDAVHWDCGRAGTGTDYDKAWLRTRRQSNRGKYGEREGKGLAELFWDRIASVGGGHAQRRVCGMTSAKAGPAIGSAWVVQGTAPALFEVEANRLFPL
jgi:hypothetical protein